MFIIIFDTLTLITIDLVICNEFLLDTGFLSAVEDTIKV